MGLIKITKNEKGEKLYNIDFDFIKSWFINLKGEWFGHSDEYYEKEQHELENTIRNLRGHDLKIEEAKAEAKKPTYDPVESRQLHDHEYDKNGICKICGLKLEGIEKEYQAINAVLDALEEDDSVDQETAEKCYEELTENKIEEPEEEFLNLETTVVSEEVDTILTAFIKDNEKVIDQMIAINGYYKSAKSTNKKLQVLKFVYDWITPLDDEVRSKYLAIMTKVGMKSGGKMIDEYFANNVSEAVYILTNLI